MTIVVPLQQGSHWTLGLTLNNRGVPLGDLRNVLYALRHAPEWQGVLAYDAFAARVITQKPLPWGDRTVEEWADDHDTRACEWMQEQGIPAAAGVVGRGIQTVARENRVHPVRDYLHALNWDGTPRLDSWLTRYLGVEDSPYVQAVGSRFLISAVVRVEQPGCKVDQVLILEGPQGILKSSALQALADPWFTDRISNLGGKDAAMEIAGVWLVEMAELDALLRAVLSATKSFVTRRHDRFRPPYGKHVVDRPRQCVFAGTINPVGGYLKDPTGGRRFWPVSCGVIDLEPLVRDRNQLWAEAFVRFRAGAPWWLENSGAPSAGSCRAGRSIRGRCLDRKIERVASRPARRERRRGLDGRTRHPARKLVAGGAESCRQNPRPPRVWAVSTGQEGATANAALPSRGRLGFRKIEFKKKNLIGRP